MTIVRALALFSLTAAAEILGCYLPYLWLKKGGSVLLLLPAAASLVLFVWLLTLHPTGAARTYAAYAGVYLTASLAWLWLVEKQRPALTDFAGAAVALLGMAIIILGHRARR